MKKRRATFSRYYHRRFNRKFIPIGPPISTMAAFVTHNSALLSTINLALSDVQKPLQLIIGESGTGKKKLATLCHQQSKNSTMVSMSAAELIEQISAPTNENIVSCKPNQSFDIIDTTKTTTLLINNIDYLDAYGQVYLLAFLREKLHQPTPRLKLLLTSSIDITETTRGFIPGLHAMVSAYKYSLPPLRERKEDISLLIAYFIHDMNFRFYKSIKGYHHKILQDLTSYIWPGNVRELKNVLKVAVVKSQCQYLLQQDILLFKKYKCLHYAPITGISDKSNVPIGVTY